LPPQPMAGVYPPVIVVQPPAQMGAGQPQAGGYLPPGQAQYGPVQYGPPATREFTVVGDGMERQHGQSHW
ncbi:MAG: FHA domain-containing protein, partial [Anaerolineae bacterium]|nr:FHA domain-containing protein [Anaerolineae bacterium]